MSSLTLLVLSFIVNCVVFANGQQDQKFFRKDYTYLSSTESFYKIHTLHRTWREAKKRCELEGSSLFYPEDDNEANEVIAFWNKTQPFSWVYIGISDLLAKGVFQTIDGRPVMDVYSNWGPGEPNDAGGVEDCVVLRRDGTLNDDRCDKKNPFICKKALGDLRWSQDCDFPRTDYTFNKDLNRCYKFHPRPKNWTEAITICSAEQSYLSIINSQAEADFLVQLTEQKKKSNAPGLTLNGAVLLGFHNRLNDEEWKTIKGQPLEDSGYSVWGGGQPDGGDNELCGSMFFNGQLNDIGCGQRCFFICEHEIGSPTEDIDVRFNDLL
ncbi:lectin c-type domain-containing protein [Phthorimaea operculella]|nr:lectin c-type domain-containing protein [Phthorimaea operculella]